MAADCHYCCDVYNQQRGSVAGSVRWNTKDEVRFFFFFFSPFLYIFFPSSLAETNKAIKKRTRSCNNSRKRVQSTVLCFWRQCFLRNFYRTLGYHFYFRLLCAGVRPTSEPGRQEKERERESAIDEASKVSSGPRSTSSVNQTLSKPFWRCSPQTKWVSRLLGPILSLSFCCPLSSSSSYSSSSCCCCCLRLYCNQIKAIHRRPTEGRPCFCKFPSVVDDANRPFPALYTI